MVALVPAVRLGALDGPRAELTDADLVDAVTRAGGKVLIGFKPALAARSGETGVMPAIDRATALAARATVRGLGAQITMSFRHSGGVAATIPPAIAPALRRLAVVDHVEPAFPGQLTQATPPQDTSWGVRKINAHLVWPNYAVRGEYANVTILDSGVDQLHSSSLAGDGPENMGGDCYWVVGTGTNCYDTQSDQDKRGHGAHVAGIIAARDHGFGYIGIANSPGSLTSIKVCGDAGCPPENLLAGLNWALDSIGIRPRHIVNISLGFCTHHAQIQQAVAQLQAAGVLVIASAGNEHAGASQSEVCGAVYPNQLPNWATSVMFPARYPEVMAVSGTLEADQFAAAPPPGTGPPGGGGYEPRPCPSEGCQQMSTACTNGSRYGPEVEIAAPFQAWSMGANGQYEGRCGTSVSAPAVAAVAALVWSRNPSWTAAQVRQRLKSTAVPYGPATQFGSGRVNAFAAVGVPMPTYTASLTGPIEVQPYATCSFSASTTSPHSPYDFDWSVNGGPTGYSGDFIYHTAGSSSFTIAVAIGDGNGGTTYASRSVTVSSEAPECYDH